MKHNLKNLAVIIVDMQDFFLKNFNTDIKRKLISNQIEIIDFCVKNKVPFIITEYKCRGIFRGKTINKIQSKLKEVKTQKIIKLHNSGFTKTNLDQILNDLKIKKLLIIGINANACVQDTTIGARHRGYKIFVSKGVMACSSRKDFELSKRNEKWFEKNTTLFKNVGELQKYLRT